MDIAYLHLITNHIPIVGVPFGLAVLLIGIWRNSYEIKAVSFLIFVFLGLATVGVFLLGQGGEDFVEDLAGVSHDAIEDHQGMATFALASVLAAAAVSALALVMYGGLGILRPRFRKSTGDDEVIAPQHRFPMWVVVLIAVLSVASSAILGYTGRLGGKIRHTEFHQTSQAADDREQNGEEGDAETEGGNRRGRNRGGR